MRIQRAVSWTRRANAVFVALLCLFVSQGAAGAAKQEIAQTIRDAPKSEIRHRFLAVGHGIPAQIVGEDRAVEWSHPVAASDGCVLDSGNVLLALYPSETFPGGGMIEVTPEHEVVFEWKGTQNEVSTAQRLASGNLMINESGPLPRMLEIDPSGKTVHEFPLACQTENFHMQTRMARRLPNEHTLAPHLFDFAVLEYDHDGKVLRRIATDTRGREVHDWPFTAIRLENGNTLIGCTHGNRVIEVDEQDEIVWQLTNEDLGEDLIRDACGIQRLHNGNTVITSYAAGAGNTKLFEVTREKQVVWRYASPDPGGVHHFQILSTDGKELTGRPLR